MQIGSSNGTLRRQLQRISNTQPPPGFLPLGQAGILAGSYEAVRGFYLDGKCLGHALPLDYTPPHGED